MEKVIKKQGKQIVYMHTVKCYKCKTSFTFEPIDVEMDRDGRYVICPSCNTFCGI
jgi:DNA-directed RNA polymerase subunit RPC12/RpoP